MIEYIKGKLAEAFPSKAIVDVNGIGYRLFIPLNTFAKLPSIGQEVFFYVSSVIREDSHKNYGFLTVLERELFEKLTDVSGIGPKTALALLGHLELEDLHLAISQGNISLISKAPGIGKKTAERLIVELKDKLKSFAPSGSSLVSALGLDDPKGVINDAISALVNLGYQPMHAHKAIKTVLSKSEKQEIELASLITAALRHI
jgi:holliday junction DNA helicase RuvA